MTFGEKLQALRKARSWSQEELATQINVSGRLCPSGRAARPGRPPRTWWPAPPGSASAPPTCGG